MSYDLIKTYFIILLFTHFRGYVQRRPYALRVTSDLPPPKLLIEVRGRLGETEIPQFENSVVAKLEEDVVGLQVPVGPPAAVDDPDR